LGIGALIVSTALIAYIEGDKKPTTIASHDEKAEQAKVYTIKLPRGVKWEPERAYHLITHMLAYGKIAFRILAEDNTTIRWQVIDLEEEFAVEEKFVGAIRAVYPDAEVMVEPLTQPEVTKTIFRAVYPFKQAGEFFRPIKFPVIEGIDPRYR
jgi:hypothetical protein